MGIEQYQKCAKFHGKSLQCAIHHAKAHKQIVIFSRSPKPKTADDWGYWPDRPDALLRAWEAVVYDSTGTRDDVERIEEAGK